LTFSTGEVENSVDTFIGGNGDDELYGGAGNDSLDGGSGNNKLDGGSGVDIFVVGAEDDFIIGAEGNELIKGGDGSNIIYIYYVTSLITTPLKIKPSGQNSSTESSYQGIETAVIIGGNSNGVIDGSGATERARLYGEGGNDYLKGSAGNDDGQGGYGGRNSGLYGGNGNDTLEPLLGNDYVDGGSGIDTLIINYFSITTDGITYTDNGDGSFTLNAVSSSVRYTSIEIFNLIGTTKNDDLRGGNLNDTLNGGAGNDTLQGFNGNDILNGGSGIDSLVGGAGNDIYTIDNVNDVIVETLNAGIDTVQSAITYILDADLENLTLIGTGNINGTGNGENNLIKGNNGNNILNGGSGVDSLIGGVGNDTYIIVDSLTILVTESANQGTDLVNSTITYTLTDNFENLTLTGIGNINGTGNALNHNIIGNDGNNTLTGNDGNDTLNGGIGNDTYIVDNTGDRITQSANQGIDRVTSTVTYTLANNVENLTLTGTTNINGIGNALNNVITGNSGNNILNGGGGADTLIGGNGNDTYTVDNLRDVIQETSTLATEIDTVQSSLTYTLGMNL
jgi:trimeric autotransporter adhesin